MTARPSQLVLCSAICACALLAGCKRPGAQGPLAPELRGPVTDLTAIRAGDEISLAWTMPQRGVRKFTANGVIEVRLCRRESKAEPCTDAGAPLKLAPGAAGTFSEKLPAALGTGEPRVLYYSVELMDRSGRPTGLRNSVPTVAGAPPPPIEGLTAETTGKGVLLRWKAFEAKDTTEGQNGGMRETTIVRLHRYEMADQRATEAVRAGGMLPAVATVGIALDVEDGARSGQALDAQIESGKSYHYRAQRVVQIRVGDQTLEMAGLPSNPAEVSTASEAAK
jgi:hypothetical protein